MTFMICIWLKIKHAMKQKVWNLIYKKAVKFMEDNKFVYDENNIEKNIKKFKMNLYKYIYLNNILY